MIAKKEKNIGLLKSKSGYTLLEIVVAVSIFVVLILLSAGIFRYVMEAQRNALSSQNLQESMRYAFEAMSREIRSARGQHEGSLCDPTDANPGYYKVYNTESLADPPDDGNELFFRNLSRECVSFSVSANGQLLVRRYNQETGYDHTFPITPDEIEVTFLSFYVVDDAANEFHSLQPRVTIVMEAEYKSLKASEQRTAKIQTTVSSRYYE